MKSNTVTIEVKKKHFDLAIAAQVKYKDLTSTCLIAQALKEAFPKKKVSVSSNYATVGTRTFDLPTRVQNLITRFDSLEVRDPTKADKNRTRTAKLRAALPVSFKMTEQVAAAAAA